MDLEPAAHLQPTTRPQPMPSVHHGQKIKPYPTPRYVTHLIHHRASHLINKNRVLRTLGLAKKCVAT
jgi:hypothetical protein